MVEPQGGYPAAFFHVFDCELVSEMHRSKEEKTIPDITTGEPNRIKLKTFLENTTQEALQEFTLKNPKTTPKPTP